MFLSSWTARLTSSSPSSTIILTEDRAQCYVTNYVISSATADSDAFNTGGTVSLNGWTVTVPKNLLVTFPSAFVPWKDFVAGKEKLKGFEVNVRRSHNE